MKEVTGTIVEAGDIPVGDYICADGDKPHVYRRALVLQFDNEEDLLAALTSTARVRTEWAVGHG